MNSEMTQQARIRRLQDTLIVAGAGVIAFTVWSFVKTSSFLFLFDDDKVLQTLGLNDAVPMTLVYITVGIVLLVDIAVRAYVGLSARAEGRGKKKGHFYLVVAVLAAIANAISAITIMLGRSATLSFADAVVSTAIEMTALTALVLVVFCSVRLRRLSKTTG